MFSKQISPWDSEHGRAKSQILVSDPNISGLNPKTKMHMLCSSLHVLLIAFLLAERTLNLVAA